MTTGTGIGRELRLELVAEAGRAPSAHNAQPARWRFTPDGGVLLFEALDRRLAKADPTGRDAGIGLGAALEGLALALSRRGLRLGPPEPVDPGGSVERSPPGEPLRAVARAAIGPGGSPDPLADLVDRRRTHRGRFATPDRPTMEALRRFVDGSPDLLAIDEEEEVARWARAHDAAAWRFLRDREYQRELHGWMRFGPGDPGWERDGLTAPCLEMSRLEGAVARVLFRPRWFGLLKAVGLARPLVSEARVASSATALLVFHDRRGRSPLETGRRFYRIWLELTRIGLAACPMSALADDEETADALSRRCGIEPGDRVVNVFRVGAPEGTPPRSPRLPPAELLV